MEWSKYSAIITEYDQILDHGKTFSSLLEGKTPAEEHESYGEQIFTKLLAHCVTLRLLSPDPDRETPRQLWDLASVSAIARSAIETYDAFAYIALGNVSPEEREFRILLWELHDTNRRAKMLEHIGSTDTRYFDIVAKDQRLLEQVLSHQAFPQITKSIQKKVHDRDPPAYYLTQRERCIAHGINFDYYTAATMQLSQYVHTLPFSVHQLFCFKAGTNEALHLMAMPLQYTLAFLCKCVVGIRVLFPAVQLRASQDTERKISLWTTLVERGVKKNAA